MWTDAVTLLDDVSVGDWIRPRLTGEPGFVTGTIPAGFAAHARILHPVDGDGRVRTWAEIAATTGRVVHQEVQWHALIGAADPWDREYWHEGEPGQGNLSLPHLLALADILAAHTTTPDDCVYALWEGWGQLNAGARSMMRMQAMERPAAAGGASCSATSSGGASAARRCRPSSRRESSRPRRASACRTAITSSSAARSAPWRPSPATTVPAHPSPSPSSSSGRRTGRGAWPPRSTSTPRSWADRKRRSRLSSPHRCWRACGSRGGESLRHDADRINR